MWFLRNPEEGRGLLMREKVIGVLRNPIIVWAAEVRVGPLVLARGWGHRKPTRQGETRPAGAFFIFAFFKKKFTEIYFWI